MWRSSIEICRKLGVLCALLLTCSIALALDAPAGSEGGSGYKLPPNLLQYFRDKYKTIDDSLISTLRETPDGPLGHLNLRGHIAPREPIQGDTRENRAGAVAMAFIKDEASLLDLPDLAELHEVSSNIKDTGETTVTYIRYVGEVQLGGTTITVDVGPDDSITRFDATLVPVPAGLSEATTRETITKDEVLKIIEKDLKTPGNNVLVRFVSGPTKAATSNPPYVVWTATVVVGQMPGQRYTIDAFTGAIINKGCTAIPIRYDPNSNPCN